MTDHATQVDAVDPGFFEIASSMRAMRRLKPDPVPPALLRRVLTAGVQAPSGQNTQPWAFLVIEDPAKKQWFAQHYSQAIENRFAGVREGAKAADSPLTRQLKALCYQMDHMHEFPVLLLVCGLRDWPFKVPQHERIGLAPPNYGAIYPCVQNILLACRALGLGAAITTMHQVFEEELHGYFDIPTDYGVVTTIPIGYPLGKFGPVSRRPAEQVTYFDRWGATKPVDPA